MANIRNFWAIIDTPGAQPIATGPRRASDGISVTIKQRERGEAVTVLTIVGNYEPTTDELILSIAGRDGIISNYTVTKRG